MKHYVLTPSHRGPDYPIEANRRRLEILRGVTVRSLASQGTDWTWLVYVNRDDPLLRERLAAFRSAGVRVVPIYDGKPERKIDWSGPVLTTRIDDDDAFARGAFAELHRELEQRPPKGREALIFPHGYRVNEGRYIPVTNRKNAWVSLYAPQGDRIHVRAIQHRRVWTLAPVRFLERRRAFLWVRHPDTLTAFRSTLYPITPEIQSMFDIDWSLVGVKP